MDETGPGKISIKKLVSLIGKLKGKRPDAREADYSRWNQTEQEYQQEQAEWLESIRRRKDNKNKNGKP